MPIMMPNLTAVILTIPTAIRTMKLRQQMKPRLKRKKRQPGVKTAMACGSLTK